MITSEERRFSHAVTRFLEQECMKGEQYTIADEQLFPRFQAFWKQVPEGFEHPALLGQFRVELIRRGFHAKPDGNGKRPHWIGLTLCDQDQQIFFRGRPILWNKTES